MARVEIYTRAFCPYCRRAKRLLRKKGAEFEEIDLGAEPERTDEMIRRAAGRTTVPQILIDDRPIGGSDDLAALEADGRLDRLLESG